MYTSASLCFERFCTSFVEYDVWNLIADKALDRSRQEMED